MSPLPRTIPLPRRSLTHKKDPTLKKEPPPKKETKAKKESAPKKEKAAPAKAKKEVPAVPPAKPPTPKKEPHSQVGGKGKKRAQGQEGEGGLEEPAHALRGLGELFLQLCCCVSFLFWREIGFGFTYYLCT
jgi:hypothetical protein